MRDNASVISTGEDRIDAHADDLDLPEGWSAAVPDESDAVELASLLRAHEEAARGWASSGEEDVLVEVGAKGAMVRENIALRDEAGKIRGWGTAHDRAAGRMLMQFMVDRDLDEQTADQVAASLLTWADGAARRVGRGRELAVQQIDSGAFADDPRQHRWLEKAGFEKVRSWWQMSRPVEPGDEDLAPEPD